MCDVISSSYGMDGKIRVWTVQGLAFTDPLGTLNQLLSPWDLQECLPNYAGTCFYRLGT